MDKKGKFELGWPVVVLIVAAAVLFYPQLSTLFPKGTTPTAPAITTQAGFVCPVDTTTLGFSAENVDSPGTAVGVNARYWIEDLPQGVVNTTSTATVSPQDKVKVWFAAADATYYGSLFNDKSAVPCKGTYDVAGKLWTKDNGVTVTVYDQENDLAQIGAANNQTIGPGESVEMRVRVKGNYQKYYGNPEVTLPNVAVVQFSKTEIDYVKLLKDGVEEKTAAVPILELITTGNTASGFEMPKISGSSNVDYMLVIKADDINNPSADPSINIYDADYFYNSNTGKIEMGYNDQSNADIGATTEPTATVYLS
jgi:hypothetical protein